MDFILQFTNESEAQSALPSLYRAQDGWNVDTCIPAVQVFKVTGTTEYTDTDGSVYTNDVLEYATGWFIRIFGEITTGQVPFDQTGWTCQPVFAS